MSQPLSAEEILFIQRSCAASECYDGPLNGVWNAQIEVAEDRLSQMCSDIKSQLGAFDPRSEKCIASLLPPAQRAAREFMLVARNFELTVRIISGTRTYAEQNHLFAIGRSIELDRGPVTKAQGGHSNHNFGIAWDVGIFDREGYYYRGQTSEEEKAYGALGALINREMPQLEWGGNWKSFPDKPHYQLRVAADVDGVRRLFEQGKKFV